MIGPALDAAWLVIAIAATLAALRCDRRVRVAVICAVALLFPIISTADDFSGDRTFDELAAAIVVVLVEVLLVAIARIHSVVAKPYIACFATASDPRSPPRA